MVETEAASVWAACVMCGVLWSPRWRASTAGRGRRWERETCWWSWNNPSPSAVMWPQCQDEASLLSVPTTTGRSTLAPKLDWRGASPSWCFTTVALSRVHYRDAYLELSCISCVCVFATCRPPSPDLAGATSTLIPLCFCVCARAIFVFVHIVVFGWAITFSKRRYRLDVSAGFQPFRTRTSWAFSLQSALYLFCIIDRVPTIQISI